MTKEEFKERWDSNDDNGGITFDDIANCAIEWGICSSPKAKRIDVIANKVTKFANCDFIYPLDDEEDVIL